MIVKEKKYTPNDLIYKTYTLEENNNSFIILDDKTFKITSKMNELVELISKYGYQISIVDLKETTKKIINDIETKVFDTIITVGTGGKQVYSTIQDENVFKNKNICLMKWNREWDKDKPIGFDTNIDQFDLRGKKIILLEDVIASGNTLFTLKNEIEKRGGSVEWIYSSLIQESSPIIDKNFCNTTAVVVINSPKEESLDPFWYPPIYSLRHLIYGDEEMNSFYEVLNEKYFNGEKRVEQYIKEMRR